MPDLVAALPTPWTVHRLPWKQGTRDAHGNVVNTWGEPEPVQVYGWYPASNQSGAERVDGRSTLTERLVLLVPPGLSVDHRDRFQVDGDTFEVDGPPRWYTTGPFGFNPGGELSLVRVTGG